MKFYAESSGKRWSYQPGYTAWVDTLFPSLPEPVRDPSKRGLESAKEKAPSDWSGEAVKLSKSLLRIESLWKLAGGIELRRTTEAFDPRWKRTTSHHSDLILYSPKSWLTRGFDPEAETLVNFCDEKERGVYSLSMLLGRSRKSFPGDLKTPPFDLADYSLSPLHEAFRGFRANVEAAGDGQSKLILTQKGSKSEHRYWIDTKRNVMLKIEVADDGKVTSTTTFSDFVEIGGTWWARSVVTTDAKGRKISETRIEITSHDNGKYLTQIAAEQTAKPQVQFLHLPGPSLKVARQHVADGSAGFEDRITMMLYNCLIQQWDELFKQLDAAEKLAADKPGACAGFGQSCCKRFAATTKPDFGCSRKLASWPPTSSRRKCTWPNSLLANRAVSPVRPSSWNSSTY